MLCANPVISAGIAFGCGQCMCCRINKRRIWAHRLMLERMCHEHACFVTLTYGNEFLPPAGPSGAVSLVPSHLMGFMKRLRSRVAPLRLRFFGVGEYGQDVVSVDGVSFGRPHFHIALYGLPRCRWDVTRNYDGFCCDVCELVKATWAKGRIQVGSLEPASASYIAGYVTKKMTDTSDARLYGRRPEFSRMSNRPGIGARGVELVHNSIVVYGLQHRPDVPSGLRHGAAVLPLGRYLQGKLRESIGRPKTAPQSVIDELSAKMLGMRLDARSSEENPSVKIRLLGENEGKREALVSRTRIFESHRRIT
ncbi:replication initiator protein [Blackfly microvirus SF02]|uniref:Replication initiator protein n=1 Tax=Blackfly microvirus SF02 TaxID=2576452 RepID=A0A4P8PKA9_9VIRU|nr:replication initiator protein [Blackfly microvirus SF02]